MKSFAHIAASYILCLTLAVIVAPSLNAETLRLNGKTMGTYFAIVIDGAAEPDSAEIRTQIEACLADINRQMSTWDPESEISRFNQSGNTNWFSVSPEFSRVVTESIRIHKLTDGAFDPTVAPLIDLWGFGAKRPKSFPTQEAVDAVRMNVGMQFIEARSEPPSIRRTRPGITLNLSAIAQGHGVDRVSELLTSMGHPSHVVDIGGENRTGVTKASGDKWRLGVESPFGELQRVIECVEESVATSGDYRNYFEVNGVRYTHVIDPATGWPVTNPPASISVFSELCMTADGLATGLMVMGTEKGFKFAKEHQLSVLFLDVVSQNKIVEHATGEFLVASPNVAKSASNESVGEHAIPSVVTWSVLFLAMTGLTISVLTKIR